MVSVMNSFLKLLWAPFPYALEILLLSRCL